MHTPLARYGATRALVLGYLLFRCGYWASERETNWGYVTPVSEICRVLRLDRATVYRARHRLRELGYLDAQHRVTYRPATNRNGAVPFLAVSPERVRLYGDYEALTLAQLETIGDPRLVIAGRRVGAHVEAAGHTLRALIGCCKKTARRVLGRLASGKCKRIWNEAQACARAGAKIIRPAIELVSRGRGYATLVRIYREREAERAKRPIPTRDEIETPEQVRAIVATLQPQAP